MSEGQYRDLVKAVEMTQHAINELTTQNRLLIRLINGSPDEDIPGVRPRLVMVERRMELIPADLSNQVSVLRDELRQMKDEWNGLTQRYLGAKWVLGILGVTNLVTLVAFARILLGFG